MFPYSFGYSMRGKKIEGSELIRNPLTIRYRQGLRSGFAAHAFRFLSLPFNHVLTRSILVKFWPFVFEDHQRNYLTFRDVCASIKKRNTFDNDPFNRFSFTFSGREARICRMISMSHASSQFSLYYNVNECSCVISSEIQ